MRWRRALEATAVVLAGVALTGALTYPVLFQIGSLGRINTDDGRWSIWVVSWVAHALTTDPRQLFDANIFFPLRYALAFSEANVGAGLIAAPVWAATGNPYTTHNVAFLAAFVMAFVGMYYLARHLSGDRLAAVPVAVLFAFCPFIFARTAHIQLLFIGTLPICLLAFHAVVQRPGLARATALGVALSVSALFCAYYGIFAALMVGLGTLVYAFEGGRWRSRAYWTAIALAAFVSIGLTIPFFLPYLYVQETGGFARTLDDARQYSANLGAWGASAAHAHRWWLDALGEYTEVLFPGLLLTVLAAIGLWRLLQTSRVTAVFYLFVMIFAGWSSFGPDAGLYWLFYQTLPIFEFLRAPARMGLMVTMALAACAAVGAAWLLSRSSRPALVTALLTTLAVLELAGAPLRQFRATEPPSPVYRVLANLPRGPVAEFPYWHERHDFPRHAFYMLNSTAHWQPLVNGYSDHIPREFRQSVLPLSSFPSRESFAILGRVGTRYVVFHLDMYTVRSRERLLQRLETYKAYLRPLAREGPVWLFEIVDWPN